MTEKEKSVVTHAVTTPNKQPPTPLTVFKAALANDYQKQVVNYFNGDKTAGMRFLTSAADYVRRVPKLLECDPHSLINALMTIASFRFMPSSVAGEAYIIPYGGQAQFQPGYKGYVTLFYRAGVKKIEGEIIRENDEFSMTNGELIHKIDLRKTMRERGAPVGAYVRVTLPSGEEAVKYMNGGDIIAHGKKFSKAFSKADSPWNADKDPELWMWKKTVLLQAAKFLPKNDELVRAMEEDFKDSTVSVGGMLDAEGPAVGAADHTPQVMPAEPVPDEENNDEEIKTINL